MLLDPNAYRNRMEGPMDGLAGELGKYIKDRILSDPELVEMATKKIRTLIRVVEASGVTKSVVQAIMEEI